MKQDVPKYSLFKLRKFYEKINGKFFARGQNVLKNALSIQGYNALYNTNLHSIDLHVKCPLYKKVK